MKLIKPGKSNPLFKFGSICFFGWKNCKLELLIVVLWVLWIKLSCYIPLVNQILKDYFTESRCSGIAGVTSIIIGIYVTVWSIFATSASKINAEILKIKVEGQLFRLIGIGLTEAFVATVMCVLISYKTPYYTEIMALFTTLTSISFIKFVVLILVITKLNIKYIVQEIDEQNAKYTELQVKLDEIYQQTVADKK